jgi:hypothetical protein
VKEIQHFSCQEPAGCAKIGAQMNSRAKGCRGERELRDVLRAAGFTNARRGQQFSGSPESPDVICEELPTIHWECKRVEAGNPYKWMEQAQRDAGVKIPVVAHKRNGQEWLGILSLSDLIRLLKESGRAGKLTQQRMTCPPTICYED